MNKMCVVVLVLFFVISCSKKKSNTGNMANKHNSETKMVVDSLLYYRHQAKQTNILSRTFPELSQSKAIEIQMAMLRKELQSGATKIGWKMGGTVTDDSASYDPVFGYLLKSNVTQASSILSLKNFPGGSINVEGEVGFVMSKNFPHGVGSMEALKKGIAYVVNAVELTMATALPKKGVPDSINFNHNLAAGDGQVGIIIGSGKTDIQDFNIDNEVVKCFINDTLAAKGISSNVYGGPLHALYSLVNMLPKYGTYLKKGEVVITGSVYPPPTVKTTSKVRIQSSTLGTIHFRIK
jgi:2-keto-4-pentenoate hydratase